MKLTKEPGEVVVIAHRGGSQLFQENTMTAFRKVQELGVDAIELDIHSTKDGKLIVIHDPDLNRMAGIDRKVADMTFEEISHVELPGGERIPDFESVLKEVKIPLVVELKAPEVVMALITIFRKNPEYIKRCVVISFYHEILKVMKNEFPELITGALLAGYPMDPVSVTKSCGADTISLYFEGLNKDYVDKCHEGGIMVSVWTPNTEEEIAGAISAGVDSIASDRPDLVLKALRR